MRVIVGVCLLFTGLLLGAKTAYERFAENNVRVEWYWWAGSAACVLLGAMILFRSRT